MTRDDSKDDCSDELLEVVEAEEGPVLFLGEGNFSFSRCLVEKLLTRQPGRDLAHLALSCYEQCGQLNTSGESRENIQNQKNCRGVSRKIENNNKGGGGPDRSRSFGIEASATKIANMSWLTERGCRVLEGVDGTGLEAEQRLNTTRFSLIVFLFPHVGGKMKIQLQRALLLGLLTSARELLARPAGRYMVALCRGQGGTPLEGVATRHPADSWRLVETAHQAGYILTRATPFPAHRYPAYCPTGYRGLARPFHLAGAVLHSLQPAEHRDLVQLPARGAGQGAGLPPSLYPPCYIHHLSAWLPMSRTGQSEQELEAWLAGLAGEELGSCLHSCRLLSRYTCQQERESVTLECVFTDPQFPLGPAQAWRLLLLLGGRLQARAGVTVRGDTLHL